VKHKLLGATAAAIAAYYAFTNPTGAAHTVHAVFGAAGKFLGALTH